MVLRICMCLVAAFWSMAAVAQDKAFSLTAPDALVETGFLKHLLPRFSLKTGIRITVNGENPAVELTLEDGLPVFQQGGTVWYLRHKEGAATDRFVEWLKSDVGERTIAAYQPDGASLFLPAEAVVEARVVESPTGDTLAGEKLSLTLCGRCHVINESNRMNAIGSTPSFAVLRTLPAWLDRFETFYVLKPHGAFTQVEDVTPPFDPARPSPIAPVELTLDDLDAIVAYVVTIEPADLGAPIQSQ